MKKFLVLALVLAAAVLMGQSGTPHNAFTPDQMSWVRRPRSYPPALNWRFSKATLWLPPVTTPSV